MILRQSKGSRIKERNTKKIVFERVEEFEIDSIEEAKKALVRIDTALQDIAGNIERLQKHGAMLEYERTEIQKFIENKEQTAERD